MKQAARRPNCVLVLPSSPLASTPHPTKPHPLSLLSHICRCIGAPVAAAQLVSAAGIAPAHPPVTMAESANNKDATASAAAPTKQKPTGQGLHDALVEAVEHIFARENIANDSFLVCTAL